MFWLAAPLAKPSRAELRKLAPTVALFSQDPRGARGEAGRRRGDSDGGQIRGPLAQKATEESRSTERRSASCRAESTRVDSGGKERSLAAAEGAALGNHQAPQALGDGPRSGRAQARCVQADAPRPSACSAHCARGGRPVRAQRQSRNAGRLPPRGPREQQQFHDPDAKPPSASQTQALLFLFL